MQNPRLFTFSAFAQAPIPSDPSVWQVNAMSTIIGDSLPAISFLSYHPGQPIANAAVWQLSGVTSNERYVEHSEKQSLQAKQPSLGRPEATCAVLIPIRKNAAWWALTQDERRAVMEQRSRHIAIGMDYLPAVARRLHHCRDLASAEPFDFLTWFEFAPGDTDAFDRLLASLRATEEWRYVEREVEIRVKRAD